MNNNNEFAAINTFFDKYLPAVTKAYEDFFRRWQATPADDELRYAVTEGLDNLIGLYDAECTRFVEETLMPIMTAALKDALDPSEKAYSTTFPFDDAYIKACLIAFKARLIKSLVDSQNRALKTVKAKCDEHGMATSELVRVFRLILGLDRRNALANWKFQQTVVKVWYPPNFRPSGSGLKFPLKAPTNDTSDSYYDAFVYSLEQLNRQATSIAATALALIYQMGNHELARLILGTSLIDGFEKIWHTAFDEKVCRTCAGLDGKVFAFDERCFQSSYYTGTVPPAHPNCRCTVEYRRIILPNGYERLDFEDLSEFVGKMSNYAVRLWYKTHDEGIHNRINPNQSIEAQARQAFEMRNLYRTQARDLMGDQQVGRVKLERDYPNWSWEGKIEDKMQRKGITREEAIADIYKTAIKSNANVNAKWGL